MVNGFGIGQKKRYFMKDSMLLEKIIFFFYFCHDKATTAFATSNNITLSMTNVSSSSSKNLGLY